MRTTIAVLALGVACFGVPSWADEPILGYVYTTDLLPKGKWELAQWATWRAQKPVGTFDVVEARSEIEYGLTDNVQFALYLNTEWARAFHNNVMDGSTLPPETMAQVAVNSDDTFESTKLTGIAAELQYRMLSPYTDGIGLSVLLEPTIGPSLREFETRIIAQKNFFDDRVILAFNTAIIQELRHLPGDPSAPPGSEELFDHWDKETDVNFGVGGSYRFARNWSAGLELINEREWAGLNPFLDSKRTNSAYFFGPTLHYAGQHLFATLTVLDQLPWADDFDNPPPGFIVDGRNYADDFERFRVRLKIGYYY